jgi:mycothiol synthase
MIATMMREETIDLTLPAGFITRPAGMEDVEAVAAVVNACSIEHTGEPEWDPNHLRVDWQSPTFSLETDTRAVVSPEGRIVAYADVWDEAPHVRLYSMGRVHPDYRGQGIGSGLADWVARRGRQSIAQAPEGARVALFQFLESADTVSQGFLREHGFRLVRYFNRMIIAMDAPPPEPAVLHDIQIRTYLRGAEEEAVLLAVRDAFQDHWGYVAGRLEDDLQEWTHWIESNPDHDPSLWFLAMSNGDIAGVSLCAPKTYEDPEMGWVDTLGVRRPWRRQGVALALLHHSFGEFYRRGVRKVGLGVDAESLTGATRLYTKAGMHLQRQSVCYEKELRPGQELSTLSIQD